MVNKTAMKIIYVILIFFCFYSWAESFLEAPRRNQSHASIRQEIGQLLADIMQQESKIIELSAKLQQVGFDCLHQILENERQSYFAKANKQKLQQALDRLKLIKNSRSLEIVQLNKDLEFIMQCAKK